MSATATISLSHYGFVNEYGFLGSDLDVVNAARVSFGKRSETFGNSEEHVLRFLMRERHGTPFENGGYFRFHVRCPIFVAREWFRHRIGSFNEMSGRYTKLEPDFYVPREAYGQVGKPGAYTFEPLDQDGSCEATRQMYWSMTEAYQTAWAMYEKMLEDGIAKELARSVLPVGIFTEFIWSLNARSLMNFLSLRTAETAQQAIREYASEVGFIFKACMPVTYDAWIENDKVAP